MKQVICAFAMSTFTLAVSAADPSPTAALDAVTRLAAGARTDCATRQALSPLQERMIGYAQQSPSHLHSFVVRTRMIYALPAAETEEWAHSVLTARERCRLAQTASGR